MVRCLIRRYKEYEETCTCNYGSRNGKPLPMEKQVDPVDEYGHIIVDFSIYDAYLAGFEEVIFVIKRENAEDFHNVIGNRIEKIMKVRYAFQELENLPEGFEVPAGRVKPWELRMQF